MKRKTTRKTPAKKSETQKPKSPSPIEIKSKYEMGKVLLSEDEAIVVSLICNAYEQKYLTIQRERKNKKSNGIWLPFKKMKEIGNLIFHAHNEGLKAGWDMEEYEPQPMNINQQPREKESESSPLKLELENTTPKIRSLFSETND